jgi:hypothetical protein
MLAERAGPPGQRVAGRGVPRLGLADAAGQVGRVLMEGAACLALPAADGLLGELVEVRRLLRDFGGRVTVAARDGGDLVPVAGHRVGGRERLEVRRALRAHG